MLLNEKKVKKSNKKKSREPFISKGEIMLYSFLPLGISVPILDSTELYQSNIWYFAIVVCILSIIGILYGFGGCME